MMQLAGAQILVLVLVVIVLTVHVMKHHPSIPLDYLDFMKYIKKSEQPASTEGIVSDKRDAKLLPSVHDM